MLEHRGTNRIETNRLLLRPFLPDDADAIYHGWASDREVTRHLTWRTHKTPAVSWKVLQGWLDAYSAKDVYRWGIVYREAPNPLIGVINTVRVDTPLEQAEIGFCLNRQYWNKGIMTEAFSGVLAYLFECGFMRVEACHHVDNLASGRVMQKCGLQYEGILRKSRKNYQGDYCDVAMYAILKTDSKQSGA